MCLTACAQKKGGERGTRQGGHMVINKDSDSVFAALKQETLGKFKQLTYNDKQTGKTMEYNLLVPEGAEAGQKLPLVLFMADASTAGKEVTAPLTQGYGALEFASNRVRSRKQMPLDTRSKPRPAFASRDFLDIYGMANIYATECMI